MMNARLNGPCVVMFLLVMPISFVWAQRPPSGTAYPRDPIRSDVVCGMVSSGSVAAQNCDDGTPLPITEREQRAGYPIPASFRKSEEPTVPSGLVSAAQLQNPLSKSGRKLLERAQADLKAGKTVEALRELKNALEDPSAAAYAHGILGSEDLKAGQVDAAIDELGEAARLMPGYQVFRSNLADAFLVNHQFQDAEREARQALRLDWASVQAHYILGMALLGQNTRIDEALDHLRAVEGTLACARDALATYQARQLSASVQRAQ